MPFVSRRRRRYETLLTLISQILTLVWSLICFFKLSTTFFLKNSFILLFMVDLYYECCFMSAIIKRDKKLRMYSRILLIYCINYGKIEAKTLSTVNRLKIQISWSDHTKYSSMSACERDRARIDKKTLDCWPD